MPTDGQKVADSANCSTTTNFTLANAVKVSLTPYEINSVTMFLLRLPLNPAESANFTPCFMQYPVLLNCGVIGYNVPEIDALGKRLRLSQRNFVGIFNGTIKYWNDSALFDGNPYLRGSDNQSILPRKRITAFFRSGRYISNLMVTELMTAGDRNWANLGYVTIQDGKEFAQKLKGQVDVRLSVGSPKDTGYSVYGYLMSKPYSIASAPQEDAGNYGFNTALLENKNGFFTSCTQEGVIKTITST